MKNPRVSRRKEILKIRAEINAKETKETIANINKAKSWFFEKINKIDILLARFIEEPRGFPKQPSVRCKSKGQNPELWPAGPALLLALWRPAGP